MTWVNFIPMLQMLFVVLLDYILKFSTCFCFIHTVLEWNCHMKQLHRLLSLKSKKFYVVKEALEWEHFIIFAFLVWGPLLAGQGAAVIVFPNIYGTYNIFASIFL